MGRLRSRSGWLGELLVGVAAGTATYAGILASLSGAQSPEQRFWALVAALLTAVLAALAARAGGYALRRTRQLQQPVDGDQLGVAPAARPVGLVHGAVPRATPFFTGRQELLSEVRQRLRGDGFLALAGLGGVGKTQLAIAYRRRATQLYDLVWWVRAEQPATLAEDYAALADFKALCEPMATVATKVASTRRWLEANGRWLLIFDNAESAAVLEPYIPSAQTGHVLVTSRDRLWPEATLEVRPWSRPESVAFLRSHSGSDEATATTLAGALGDLPLALEQARAYLQETERSVPEYLNELQARSGELLARGTPLRYAATVATTWWVSLERVREQAPAAELLLRLFAFLAPDDIPRVLVPDHLAELPKRLQATAADHSSYDAAISILGHYSLTVVTEDSMSIHRLVQAVVRRQLDPRDQRRWTGVAVRLVDSAFPTDSDEVAAWPTCGRFLAHAIATADHADAQGVECDRAVRLLNRVVDYLWARGQFQQARELAERALSIGERHLGLGHPDVAYSLNNLGVVLAGLGKLSESRTVLERALAIREAKLGPDHLDVAESLNNLGGTLQELGDLPAARAAVERALAIREARLRPDAPLLAATWNNLGQVLRELGDLPPARAALEHAVKIWEAQPGADHPHLAFGMSNLGLVLRELGDLEEARAAQERALAIREAKLEPDHPDLASSLSNLGLVLHDLGDLPGARAALERALAIRKAKLGPDHSYVVLNLSSLGSVLRDAGDLPAARAALEQAATLGEQRLGPGHPLVAEARSNLDAVLADLGNSPDRHL
jgi:tetratricopeptide (TPR) repeat protein